MIPFPKLHKKDTDCPCCYGTGVQYNKITGLNVICPCCGGTGKKRWVDPYNPKPRPKRWVYGESGTWRRADLRILKK